MANENKFDKMATGIVFALVATLGIGWLLFMGWVIVTIVGWITSK